MRKQEVKKGLGLHARRVIAYTVLIIISFFCLFWFYVLFINATRSNGELQAGFTAVPSTHLFDNWNNLLHGTLPVIKGLVNSLIISSLSAVLTVYFSTMTAYAIHAYDFRLKKYIYTFILAVMMIPTQVTALGFIRLMRSMNLMDSFIPLIVPAVAAPITFFYMKQYMESTLPLSLIEAARIDGSGIKYAIRGERFSEQMPIVCLLRSTARNTGYLSRTPLVLAGFGSLIFLAVLTALLLHLYAKGHDTGSRLRILRWLFRTDGKKRTFHIG